MNTELTVSKTRNYGNDVIYPECSQSKLFTQLTKTVTLTDKHISILKQLGYTFTVKQEVI